MRWDDLRTVITIFIFIILMFFIPVEAATDGDCLGCHNDTAPILDVNVSSMNSSVHANLNNLTPINGSINPLNKACWACHGNGTAPDGNHSTGVVNATNPANYTNPLDCNEGDCHLNGRPPGSNVNISPIPSIIEHVPDINTTTDINTIDNCSYCHNMSLTPWTNTDSTNETIVSNTSHYASKSNLLSNTVDCNLCHKNASIGSQWNVSATTRHPVNQSVDFCRNCHGSGITFHNESYAQASFIHQYGFDWEGDGIDYFVPLGAQPQDNEGCAACHGGYFANMQVAPDGSDTVICEECHYDASTGVYTGPFDGNLSLRPDINNTIPRVYNHINHTSGVIKVTNLSLGSISDLNAPSSCFSYNNNTGNGSCHGIRYDKRIEAGGYYAFNNFSLSPNNMSPYEYTMTIDRMPNTSDCRICHLGANATVGRLVDNSYWGYPMNVTSTRSYAATAHTDPNASASDCWICHVEGAIKPRDFHNASLTRGGDPNCIKCHAETAAAGNATARINITAFNMSVHGSINRQNATDAGYTFNSNGYNTSINGACWACHDTDGNVTNSMGDKYTSPWICTDCHINSGVKFQVLYNGDVTPAKGVFNHFKQGGNITSLSNMSYNISSCINCHENVSDMIIYNNDTTLGRQFVAGGDGERLVGGNQSFYHYGKNRNAFGKTPGSVEYCQYCHKNATGGGFLAMFTDISNTSVQNHTLRYNSTNPGCNVTQCHASTGYQFHDQPIGKPVMNDSLCQSCHGSAKTYAGTMVTTSKARHNQTVNCTTCHTNNSTSIHPVDYLQNDGIGYSTSNSTGVNCSTCHQYNQSYSVLQNQNNLIAPLIPTSTNSDFNHSEDAQAGMRWNTTPYWTADPGACYYCHNDTKHQVSALGTITSISGGNTRGQIIQGNNSTWCSNCHYSLVQLATGNYSQVPPTIDLNNTGLANATDDLSVKWYNHTFLSQSDISTYNDYKCVACHGSQLSGTPTTTEFVHNAAVGAFGPDCIGCHDITQAAPRINVSAVNGSNSIHRGINNNTPNPSGVPNDNKICWACHMDNGTSPLPNEHADRLGTYNGVTPYTCYECHNNSSKPYLNVSNAPNVTEHFKGGKDLKAASSQADNTSACILCHSLNEMLVPGYGDPDNRNTNLSNVSHYGLRRSAGVFNLRTGTNGSVNCSYCHYNSSSAFKVAMTDPVFNTSISNHSLRYNSSTPNCTASRCHNEGWMHNASLQKPDLTTTVSGGAEDSRICLACHGPGNYSTYTPTTGLKQLHNNSLNCTECHLYVSRDIHGVKYLQKDDTYATSNLTAVDCQVCHASNNITNITASDRPRVPLQTDYNFSHSQVANNGSRWNSTPYWNTTNGACEYCHDDTKHQPAALGRISNISSGNARNASIGNDQWCASCHYRGSRNYANMSGNYSSLPPEITNGSNWQGISLDYFNHTLGSYNDSACEPCHGSLLTAGTTKEFVHRASEGVYGANCTLCHDLSSTVAPRINFSVVSDSLSIHSNVSNYSAINNPYSANTSDINRVCWLCHMNDSTAPAQYTDHADRVNTTDNNLSGPAPYTCEDCHVVGVTGSVNITVRIWAPDVAQHFASGSNLTAGNTTDNLTSCMNCHNLSQMKLDPNLPAVQGLNGTGWLSLVSHYGKSRSRGADNLRTWDGGVNCSYCHQNSSAFGVPSIMADPVFNSSILNHSLRYNSTTPNCTACHNGGWMHNLSLQKPHLTTSDSGGAEDSRICLACHGPGNYSTYTPTTGLKQLHNNSLNCTECHLYVKQDIHGVKYLQGNDTYTFSNSTAVNCLDCHASNNITSNLTAVSRPMVPTQTDYNFSHSTGSGWNSTPYWTDTNGACEFCHNDTKHQPAALGRISNISSGNARNTSIGDDQWCASCHYRGSRNYANMSGNYSSLPPEITNGSSWQGISAGYFNHTLISYNDSACQGCHGYLLVEFTTREFPHKVAKGAFGANCTLCHDLSSNIAPRINVTAALDALSIHSNVSNYTAVSNPYSANTSDINRVCWLCHMNNSTAPANYTDHGDRINTLDNSLGGPPPFTCDQCHVVGAVSPVNTTVLGWAPDVVQHFASGSNLTAGNTTDNLSSCRNCHNLSEMKLDPGLPVVQGLNGTGWLSLVSHYGKVRSTGSDNLRTWAGGVNCSYCHQNSSSAFGVPSIMADPVFNSSIPDHSLRYPSSPANNCTNSTCHNGGWMHNASLQKPDLTTSDSGGAEDSRICLTCHGPGNYTIFTPATGPKQQHNGSLNCTECHLYVKRDIHGVKYLQKDNTYTNSSSSAVDCVRCHNNDTPMTNITLVPPLVPTNSNVDFNHSEDPDNGSRWANASVVAYWNQTNGACHYCHNDSKHDVNAFGKVHSIQSANNRNQSITGGTWCAGCHLLNASNYLVAGNFTKIPPTIFINNTQLANATDDPDTLWFNHTLNSYTDDSCKLCHGGLLSGAASSKEFVHNVEVGKFGSDCVSCHDLSSTMAPRINVSVLTTGIHANLSNASGNSNRACWACHGGATDGTPPSTHPFLYEVTPRTCEDCHLTTGPSLFNAPLVSEHRPGALDVETNATNASCVRCHNNSVNSTAISRTVNASDWVSHYGNTDNLLTWVTNKTQDCMYCHFTDPYNVSWGYPMDPRITITNFNHSQYNSSPSSACYYCHASNNTPPTFHDESVTGGAGKDCVSCHDLGGAAPTPKWLDISSMNDSKAIHYDLNRKAAATTSLDPSNVRCWACHGDGDGTDAAQPDGHPTNYRTPRNCNNNSCHAVNQSIFGEPMVYEHFRFVDDIDEDLKVNSSCEVCHKNSVQGHRDTDVKSDVALVSHYGNSRELIDSSQCTYCHLDEDNAEDWGNAPDPTDNESSLSETTRKATLLVGDKWHVGSKYLLYFKDISSDGDKAYIQVWYDGQVINESFVLDGEQFLFTRDMLDKDGDEFTSVIFSVNITGAFRGHNNSLITVKGRTMKRIHSESVDESCYACHVDNYTRDMTRYIIVDKDNDYTYYTQLYLDFDEDDINKQLLSSRMEKDIVITEGYNRSWTVDGFRFTAKEVDINGDKVYISLDLNGETVVEDVYRPGDTIEYDEDVTVNQHTIDDLVLFRADVDQVFHGIEADAVMLTNVRVMSSSLAFADNDDEIAGYNVSWLQIDEIFNVGGAPENLHVPPLNDGVDGGPDCVMCHDVTSGFGIPTVDAISTQLGGHAGLNENASNRIKLTDTINKACWACHGDGEEPEFHPTDYLFPRRCRSCHVNLEQPNYNAISLADVPHGQVDNCGQCHENKAEFHVINVFNATPQINDIRIRPQIAQKGDPVVVNFTAVSGWNMYVKDMEYFFGEVGPSGSGIHVEPDDGAFDEQIESGTFTIDTSDLERGTYVVYVHAMERDNEWGPVRAVMFSIEPEPQELPWWILTTVLGISGLMILLLWSGLLEAPFAKGNLAIPPRVKRGEKVRIVSTAVAGLFRAVGKSEYFIDGEGEPGTGITMDASGGLMEKRTVKMSAEIDTSGLAPGTHTVYIRTMQNDGQWGNVQTVTFEVEE